MRTLAAALMLGAALAAGPLAAQERYPVCETQQQLEQLLQSDGRIVPDGCREAVVTTVETPAGRLCMIDLSSGGEGIVETLQDAAANTEWWTACSNFRGR